MAADHGHGGGPRPAGKVDGFAHTAYGEFVPAPGRPAPVAPSTGVPIGAPAQPAPGPFVPGPRPPTPTGEITAVTTGASAVARTGAARGWMPPSETPTQVGEISGLRSLAGETGSGVMTGQTLGERYRIVRKIGAGGMGEVWEAKHIVINKPVAVKVLTLDPTLTNGAEQAERLIREARVVASVSHDNVVDITDFGHTPMGAPYFVMELLQGRTLKEVIATEGAVPWPRATAILLQLADAFGAAHMAGVIHRDIKPDNIFLVHRADKEVAKIIDFGIAKTTLLGEDARTLTQTGMVCGTPAFMSPEQARGERIDERTDVYSLGCLAWQLLTGRQPFLANSPAEALYQQLFVEPTPMNEVAPHLGIPAQLDAIVLTCMRKNRNLRFQSMDDLHRALTTVGTNAPVMAVPSEALPVPPSGAQTQFGPTPRDPAADSMMATALPRRSSGVALALGGVAIALALGAGGGGAYYFLVMRPAAGPVEAAPAEPVAAEAEVAAPEVAEPEVPTEPEAAVDEPPAADPAAPVPVETQARGRPRDGAVADPRPIEITRPVFQPDADHVADGQGPEPLPPPPEPLPDAQPDPEPAPVPAPEPAPEPPIQQPKPPKPKPDQPVEDLRDPWERG